MCSAEITKHANEKIFNFGTHIVSVIAVQRQSIHRTLADSHRPIAQKNILNAICHGLENEGLTNHFLNGKYALYIIF